MLFFILFGHVFGGRVAVVAGTLAGWLIDSQEPRRWALALAVLLFVSVISGNRWKVPPGLIDLIGEILQATIPAILGAVAFLFAFHRFRALAVKPHAA